MKIGIFYGSTTGNTERIAELLEEYLQEDVYVKEISELKPEIVHYYDLIIFGIPTWNLGELEDSWNEFYNKIDEFDFSKSVIALYGLGDQISYEDTFLDAMGIVYNKLKEKGGIIIGFWSTKEYSFSDSLAVVDQKFVGLALDEDNQYDKTESRVIDWINQVKIEYTYLVKGRNR